MNRVAVVTAVAAGGVFAFAVPAYAAEPPVFYRQSGDFETLSSNSLACAVEAAGVQTCTELSLNAAEDPSGSEYVSLVINRYAWVSGNYTPISFESGTTATDGAALTVTRKLNATLVETAIPLSTCDGFTCQTSRTIIVSAQDAATGPAETARQVGSFEQAGCTWRFHQSSLSAPVAGTITVDGVTYDEVGLAARGTNRVTSLC